MSLDHKNTNSVNKKIWFARLVAYRFPNAKFDTCMVVPNLAKFLRFPFRTADVLVSPQIHLVDQPLIKHPKLQPPSSLDYRTRHGPQLINSAEIPN